MVYLYGLKFKKFGFLLLFLVAMSCSKEKETAQSILNKSVAFHDPEGEWSQFQGTMHFEEAHSASVRKTTFALDNQTGKYFLNRGGEEMHGMEGDSVFLEKGTADEARIRLLRNYYLYLWGLPMKLNDDGTELRPEFEAVTWDDFEVYEIYVDYETDSWTYYIDRSDYQLRGYKFVKKDGSGEWIELEGLVPAGSAMRIPGKRDWYVLSDSSHLGTDNLKSVD